MNAADDRELRPIVIAAIGTGRNRRVAPVVTTSGLDVLVDGVEVCRALSVDHAAVVSWLRSLLRRWGAAARRRARRHRAYLYSADRRRDVAMVERALAARRGAR